MSLLQSFAKVKVLPTAEETEIREKSTKEADKCVAEVLNQQNNPAVNARHTLRRLRQRLESTFQ